jgi:hypothetical protein
VSAFVSVCAAFERVTRVRPRHGSKLLADCPICRLKRRLQVEEGRDGRVVIHCHADCDTGDILARCGLEWRDLFEEVSYSPPTRAAAQLVLAAIDGTRWTIVTHDFDDADLALAVEIVERLLPARHRVRHLLRLRSGRKISSAEFPLTVGFVQQVARKLGRRVGEHRAGRLIRSLQASGVIEYVETISVPRPTGATRLRIFRLADGTARSWDERLRRAVAPRSRRSRPTTRAAATSTRLSAGRQLSTRGAAVVGGLHAAQKAQERVGRGPPTAPDARV